MKAYEFCYWLQGMFELGKPETLNAEQTDLVKRHLAMVFQHDIDQSYPSQQQADLLKLHSGPAGSPIGKLGGQSDGVIYRC